MQDITFNWKVHLFIGKLRSSIQNIYLPAKLMMWPATRNISMLHWKKYFLRVTRNISYELPEIFLSSYPKYFLQATRNIFMLHLECCTYSTEKFSWQGLAKSEMDSGKECSVQFWAPNGSNKLLESFLRVSSLQSSFLCSWIDDFDVTLIMRNQSLKRYNQQTTYLHPIFAKYLSSNVTLYSKSFYRTQVRS